VLALQPPVEAPIVRPFSYAGSPFAAGLHRGIDLGVPPGAEVVAPCGGVVAYAGDQGVTLVCAGRRVTLLPLGEVGLRAGDRVAAGQPVGRVGRRGGRHAGLHLGVRRAGDAFGYVDPEPLLRRAPSPPLGPAPAPVRPRESRRPAPAAPPARPVPAPVQGVAPWPAWAGLALAAVAAAGSARVRVRRPETRRRERRRAAQG
jgi:hypothetical protein